jgi:hypothetical protein
MRLTTSFRWLLAPLLAAGSLSAAQASHILGGDISYASIASTTAGVPRYHVVVRKFENAASPGSPIISSNVELRAAQNGCYTPGTPTSLSFTVALTSTASGPVQQCGGGFSPYRVLLFETDVNLPAGQWRLSTSDNARIADIQNITNSPSSSFYMEAYLDNTVTTQDTSPKFESVLQPSFSTVALSQHSFSAFDVDGDSLRYEQIVAYNNCNQLVSGGTLAPQFHLNFATGAFEPMVSSSSIQGYYSTVVRVNEYRKVSANRWALIGSVMRDQSFALYPTTNQPPTFTTMQVNGGAAQALGPAIAVQPGQTVSVLLQATDPDASQTLRFASEAPNVVPGLTLTRVGTTNSEQLTWQVPGTLPPGRYAIAVGVLDNGCINNASEERTLTFVVGSTALATRAAATATDVFPVPFREQVQFTTAPNQAVILVDALGREVARLTSAPSGLVRWQPAPSLPAGLYLARSASSGQPLARLLRAE